MVLSGECSGVESARVSGEVCDRNAGGESVCITSDGRRGLEDFECGIVRGWLRFSSGELRRRGQRVGWH